MANVGQGLFKKYLPKNIHEKVCTSSSPEVFSGRSYPTHRVNDAMLSLIMMSSWNALRKSSTTLDSKSIARRHGWRKNAMDFSRSQHHFRLCVRFSVSRKGADSLLSTRCLVLDASYVLRNRMLPCRTRRHFLLRAPEPVSMMASVVDPEPDAVFRALIRDWVKLRGRE